MKDGKALRDLAIEALGGLERWNQFSTLTASFHLGGVTWEIKGQKGVLNNVIYQANLHQQQARYLQFGSNNQQSFFEPDRVAIETKTGQLVEELANPRASFAGQTFESPWSQLQLIYFSSYAMWTYLTSPFNFTLPGYKTVELDTWSENGETWRRLDVTFPEYIATHTAKQIFYYDQTGLLKRHDYRVEVLANSMATHYPSAYTDFDGIRIATQQMVYQMNSDGSHPASPVLVSINIDNVAFS